MAAVVQLVGGCSVVVKSLGLLPGRCSACDKFRFGRIESPLYGVQHEPPETLVETHT